MNIKKIISSILAVVTIAALLPVQAVFADEAVAEVVEETPVQEIIFNKESEEYKEISGIFQDDLRSKCPYGKTTRNCYSRYGKLGYEFKLEESGNYKLEYWNPFSTNAWSQRNQQLFTITIGDKVTEVKLNLKFVGGWKELGIYTINAGEDASVILSREIKDGGIRSGALRLTKTTEAPYVVENDAPVKIERYYPEGSGTLVTVSRKSDAYTVEKTGSFGTIALHDATGKATEYSYTDNASVKYKINLKDVPSKTCHVMLYVMTFPDAGDTRANTNQRVDIRYVGNKKTFNFDNTKGKDRWVYLGEYTFSGEENYIELFNGEKDINNNSKMLLIGGAYFVDTTDPDFDPSKYPSITDLS